MSPEIVLYFHGGHLQPLKTEDIHHSYISGLNDYEVNRYLEVRHAMQTEQSVVKFVLDNQQDNNAVLFGIWRDGVKSHCGTLRLHGIEHSTGSAHIGVCVFDKSAWGHRIGSKAIASATRWAIDHLELRCVEAGVYAENVASQKAFLDAGYEWHCDIPGKFVYEGNPTVVKIYIARKAAN
jgi:ribosomal-protein-alanine N-acetyltransferase